MTKKKKIVWIVSIVALTIIILTVVNLTMDSNDATMVQADLAYTDDLSEIVSVSGRIEPQTKVNITSEVSAQIVRVAVTEGDWVNRGQLLIQLDTVQLNASMEQAKYTHEEVAARTDAAYSQYEKNKLEFARQTKLYQQKLTSETEYTNAKFAHQNSKANHNAAKAQLKTSKAGLNKALDNLSKTRIVAPMDGVLTFLNVEEGEIAQAQTSFTQGKTLMTISDLSVFEVEVDVDETEIAKINLNQKSSIKVDAFRDTLFSGTVVEIGNSARVTGEGTENYSTSFKVKVRFDENHARIRPGMSATVEIVTATTENALLVPYAAVITRTFDDEEKKDEEELTKDDSSVGAVFAAEVDSQDEIKPKTYRKKEEKEKLTGVFVIREGKAEFVEITTGIADERNIVALSGLMPGDTVISGSFKTIRNLKRGDGVKIDERSVEKMKEFE